MKNRTLLLLCGALTWSACLATDRSIAVPPKVAMSWGYLTNSTVVKPSRTMGVGFWQRASGAKPGVGEVFVTTIEYQLPEAAPARVRSASFRFSGKPSQCVGAEPVVVDVYAYAADGKADVNDSQVGSKIAQLSADCTDNAAFARPIDVTHIVRQASVASGIRFVGFNIRKANNRQGPGLFALSANPLTIVISDQEIDRRPMTHAAPGANPAAVAGVPAGMAPRGMAMRQPTSAPAAGVRDRRFER
jgi:hypothetical protein